MTKEQRAQEIAEALEISIIDVRSVLGYLDAELAGVVEWDRHKCPDCNYQWTSPPKEQLAPLKSPEVVCLCGSTRFADQHAIKRWELEQDGKAICVMINYLPAWYADEQDWDGNDHFGEKSGRKEILDELHLRKIDMSDRVFVLNVDGYIGESTANEIAYAVKTGKHVDYLEPLRNALCGSPNAIHDPQPDLSVTDEPQGGGSMNADEKWAKGVADKSALEIAAEGLEFVGKHRESDFEILTDIVKDHILTALADYRKTLAKGLVEDNGTHWDDNMEMLFLGIGIHDDSAGAPCDDTHDKLKAKITTAMEQIGKEEV